MDIERARKIPNHEATRKNLAKVCLQTADVLSASTWNKPKTRTVLLQRLITERHGFEIERESLEESILPIETTITASFHAEKRELDVDEETTVDYAEYEVRTAVTQEIDATEIPLHIREEMLADMNESRDEDRTVPLLSMEAFEEFLLERQEEVTYQVTEEGDIDEYVISHSYKLDETPVYQQTYSLREDEEIFVPVHDANGNVSGNKPLNLTNMTPESIAEDAAQLDISWKRFLETDSLKRLMELDKQDKKYHYKRVLSIIALISSGLIH